MTRPHHLKAMPRHVAEPSACLEALEAARPDFALGWSKPCALCIGMGVVPPGIYANEQQLKDHLARVHRAPEWMGEAADD